MTAGFGFIKVFVLLLPHTAFTSPLVRTAPEVCPLKDGNILNVKLFTKDDIACRQLCQEDSMCNFYKFYPSLDGKPPQCFFFETCGRTVYEAGSECVLNKENCLGIRPFVSGAEECMKMCQNHRQCGYYKYVASDEEEAEGSGSDIVPKGRQIPIARLADADTPEFCYLLSSCSKRMIENVLCTIGANNFLDVKLFVPNLAACQQHCETTQGCRYYYWYPIDYSSSPLYCYLFQQCAAKDDEPEVALVVGGRHPGHYFIDSDDFNDIVTRNEVCPVRISPADARVKRAGASSIYAEEVVLLCGGRSGEVTFSDCLSYDLDNEVWSDHSLLLRPRDESAMAKVGSQVLLIGGLYETTVEVWDPQDRLWKFGSELPNSVARGCAAGTGETVILTGGHDNSSTASLATTLRLSTETGGWEEINSMLEPRRDHACMFLELERKKGILVTGGLGDRDQVLDSAEFFNLETNEWTRVAGLKIPRTEHSMNLVYGIPTVIGGVNGDEFLSSMEQFDKSGSSWNVPLQRDWKIVNSVLTSPRYEHTVASVPVSPEVGACVWFKHDFALRDFKLRERIKIATWPNPINTSSTLNIEPNFNKLNATVTSDDWFENHRSSRINYSIILDYFKTPTNKKKVPIKDFIDSVITSKDVAVQTNQSGDLIPLATGFLVHATYLAPLLVAAAGAALIAFRSYRSQPPAFLSSCLRHNSVRPLNNDYAGPVCSALDYDPLRPCRPAWESSPPPPPGGSRLFRPARGLRQNQAGKTNSIIITDL